MPTQIDLLQEAYKRGILPPEKVALYDEAVRRGLIGGTVKEDITPELSQAEKWRQFRHEGATSLDKEGAERVSGIVRPTLEAAGLIGGGAVAGGTTLGVGTVAGAAGGFAIGSAVADRLDEFLGLAETAGLVKSSVKAAKDIRTGATYEMGGQVALPALALGKRGVWDLAKKMGLSRSGDGVKSQGNNGTNSRWRFY
jgi:hypothetical protein